MHLNQILCDTTWNIGSWRGGKVMESVSLCRCSMSHSAPEIRSPAGHSVDLVLLIDRRCRSSLLRQKNMPHLALWWPWVDIWKCDKPIGKTFQLVVITPDRCTSLRSVRLKIRYRGPYTVILRKLYCRSSVPKAFRDPWFGLPGTRYSGF